MLFWSKTFDCLPTRNLASDRPRECHPFVAPCGVAVSCNRARPPTLRSFFERGILRPQVHCAMATMATAHDPVGTLKKASVSEGNRRNPLELRSGSVEAVPLTTHVLQEEDSHSRLVAAFSHAAFRYGPSESPMTFSALTINVARYGWLAKALAEKSVSALPYTWHMRSIGWDDLVAKAREWSSSAGVALAASQEVSSFIVEKDPFVDLRRPELRSAVPDASDARAKAVKVAEELVKKLPALKPLKLVRFQGMRDGYSPLLFFVHVIDVEGSALGNIGTQTLSGMLRDYVEMFNFLAVLNLSGNSIEDAGAQDLAAVLGGLHDLTLLDLSSNSIGAEGTEALAKVLCGVKTGQSTSIDLRDNPIILADANALVERLKGQHNASAQAKWRVPSVEPNGSSLRKDADIREAAATIRIIIDDPPAPPEVRPGPRCYIPRCECPARALSSALVASSQPLPTLALVLSLCSATRARQKAARVRPKGRHLCLRLGLSLQRCAS